VSSRKLWTILAPTTLLVSGVLLLLLMPSCLHSTSGSQNRSVMDLDLPQGWTNVTGSVSPAALGGGMMAYDSSADLFVLFGGSDGEPTNGTWTLSPQDGQWTKLNPLVSPPARADGMFVYDERERAFVLFGGWYEPSVEWYTRFGDTWVFYLENATWIERHPSSSPPPRSDSAVGYDPASGAFIVFGGFDGTYLGDMWSYDFLNNTWRTLTSQGMPSPRADGRLTYDPSTRAFYLFGGNDYSGPNRAFHHLGDTWRYRFNGNSWSELFPAVSPAPRDYAVFATVGVNGELLTIGGYGNKSVLGDLWTFNTSREAWADVTVPGGPSPRMAGVGGYAPPDDVFVVFSGADLTSGKTDTWFLRYPPPLMGQIQTSSTTVQVGQSLTLTAESVGGSGFIVHAGWDFGDGNTASGFVASHAYALAGIFSVRFTAVDDHGDSVVREILVTVANSLPTWEAGGILIIVVVGGTAIILITKRRRRTRE